MKNTIKSLRCLPEYNLSQAKLAEELGTSRDRISAIENGAVPSGKLMLRICTYFNRDIREIFFDDGVVCTIQSSKKNSKSSELSKQNEVMYDEQGRMLYHPDFHHNQGKRFTDEETAYLCKFYATDTLKSLSLALGRLEKSLAYRIAYLKKTGLIDYYRSKWDRQMNA